MEYVLLTDIDHVPVAVNFEQVKFMKGNEDCTDYTEIVFTNNGSIIVEESLFMITTEILPRYHKMSWDSALSTDVVLCCGHECNKDIYNYARAKGVKLWQIAEAMGISKEIMIRILRSELSEQDKQIFERTILALSNGKSKEEK